MNFTYYVEKFNLKSDSVTAGALRLLLMKTPSEDREALCGAMAGQPEALQMLLRKGQYKILNSSRDAAKFYVKTVQPNLRKEIYDSIMWKQLARLLKAKRLLYSYGSSYIVIVPND